MSRPLLFTPLTLRDVTLKNRVVVAPMHQYAAKQGFPTDWHLMNVGRFAVGGAGLVFVESTKVDRQGCGTVGDLGIWDDAFVPHFKRLSGFIKEHGAASALQLGHSGRKARRFRPWEGGAPLAQAAAESEGVDDWEAWELVAPTAVAMANEPEPRALSRLEIQDLVEAWGKAATRAEAAGFDVLEIHGAHGYLIHQFLSPVANLRNDDYGGSEANRRRFAVEVTEAVRANWPDHKPLFLRLSVEDDAGWGPDDSVVLSRIVKELGVDVIDCSSGGMRGSPVVGTGPVGYGYQVPYAAKVKSEADILAMAVGLIVHADQAEQILRNGEADLIALAREFLHNPNWTLDAAQKLGLNNAYDLMPSAYKFWLEKRESAVQELVTSTQQSGIVGA
ncbi:MAG: NADH:flavin oxidoreductase/NADH oxidase [Alphaproteobacteria bacterium]